jgi:hypothetical protein
VLIAGKDFFREELPWSLVVYYIVFVACAIVFIPYGPFCIAIGFIFGYIYVYSSIHATNTQHTSRTSTPPEPSYNATRVDLTDTCAHTSATKNDIIVCLFI